MLGTLLLGISSQASAYSVKKTPDGSPVRWEVPTVTVTVGPEVDRAVAGASEATSQAMSAWSGRVGAPDFERGAVETAPTEPGLDRKNGIFFKSGGYAPAGSALAVTVLTYDKKSGEIVDADIVINGTHSFEVLKTGAMTDVVAQAMSENITHATKTYDLQHVIAHELGHSLGLNDEHGNDEALMYIETRPNDASIREPRADDIAGVTELYGSKADQGKGCAAASVAPKQPSSTDAHAAAILALGLVLFLLVRSRSDRRARIGFGLATAAVMVAFMPQLSPARAASRRDASALSERVVLGDARAKVVSASTAIENGLFKTSYTIATMQCHRASCPQSTQGSTWGGTIGDLVQEVGTDYAPAVGDEVDVSFRASPSALHPITHVLGGHSSNGSPVKVSALHRVQ